MKLLGEEIIQLPIESVWAGLNDPAVLQRCIPGCEDVVKVDDTHYTIRLVAVVGPVRVKFAGALEMADMNPPNSYSLVFEGKGGAAGFAKGRAQVNLTELAESQTRLSYEVEAQIGGKLAQIGARLIDSVAAKTSAEFFAAFKEVLASPTPESAARTAPGNASMSAETPAAAGASPGSTAPAIAESGDIESAPVRKRLPVAWLVGGAVVIVLAIVYFS